RGKYAGSAPVVPDDMAARSRSVYTWGNPSSAARTGNHSSMVSPTSMRALPARTASAGASSDGSAASSGKAPSDGPQLILNSANGVSLLTPSAEGSRSANGLPLGAFISSEDA